MKALSVFPIEDIYKLLQAFVHGFVVGFVCVSGFAIKRIAELLGKSRNIVNVYVQKRKQQGIKVLVEIGRIMDLKVADSLAGQKEE